MISFLDMLLRMGLALLLGALIGFERERREHEAGMRTIALVSLGACLFTLVSAYGFLSLLGIPHVTLDPTRVASYIVAGIGFLGGGSIFLSREGNRVKGLTTAAVIWLVAAIGVACGAGLLVVAVAATVLELLALIVLRYVERLLLPAQFESRPHIRIEATPIGGELIGQVYDILSRAGISAEKLEIGLEQESKILQIACHTLDARALAQVVGELRILPGVRSVRAGMGTPRATTATKDLKLAQS